LRDVTFDAKTSSDPVELVGDDHVALHRRSSEAWIYP
jgi:hypothetical protein